jgi:uncharacterized membrane protein
MDDVIIFLFFLLAVVVVVSMVVAAYRGGRKEGYEEGVAFGILSERLRRLELEREVEDKMVRRAMRGEEDEFSETEIDA